MAEIIDSVSRENRGERIVLFPFANAANKIARSVCDFDGGTRKVPCSCDFDTRNVFMLHQLRLKRAFTIHEQKTG
jgi:hypothetical protein